MKIDGKNVLELDPNRFEEDRKHYTDGVEKFINRKNAGSGPAREAGFLSTPLEKLREKYIEMLGINAFGECLKEAVLKKVGSDDIGTVYRLTVYITEEIPFSALLIVPHGAKNAPLIIAQHGGGGTPELCSGFVGKNNYNHMVYRALSRGAVVCAPQLMLWSTKELETARKCTTEYDRAKTDHLLKRFGTSITGLEIKGISKLIDYLCETEYVNSEKIGMIGSSYGGYFTVYTMAFDKRIKRGFSAAAFNDKGVYDFYDWCHKNSALTFQDAEVAGLCIPRGLYVSVGKDDAVFDYKSAVKEAERAKKYYESYGAGNNFVFQLWEGGHTIPNDEAGFDFLFETDSKNN